MLACHDRSDGGALVAIAEMCFAGHCGAEISLSSGENGIAGALFSEEIGLVLQVSRTNKDQVASVFSKHAVAHLLSEIGVVTDALTLTVSVGDQKVLQKSVIELKRAWWETSYQMQRHRDNPVCAEQEFACLLYTSDAADE